MIGWLTIFLAIRLNMCKMQWTRRQLGALDSIFSDNTGKKISKKKMWFQLMVEWLTRSLIIVDGESVTMAHIWLKSICLDFKELLIAAKMLSAGCCLEFRSSISRNYFFLAPFKNINAYMLLPELSVQPSKDKVSCCWPLSFSSSSTSCLACTIGNIFSIFCTRQGNWYGERASSDWYSWKYGFSRKDRCTLELISDFRSNLWSWLIFAALIWQKYWLTDPVGGWEDVFPEGMLTFMHWFGLSSLLEGSVSKAFELVWHSEAKQVLI